ncbi:universal stress protein [Dethiobacter alkaliphilus]|uniref:universal stress protein n=1 Tax=Dethiobacter alkaliphilus TaxID=427926 RepID=UPI002225CCF1|nr:universal stress protein [Dethiobacter alkaliphilus]MCW3489146.1 universal stress protein [Dethiobacter alkaliphilus]
MLFKKILLATDFSQCAEQLWNCAGELRELGAKELVAVHVAPLTGGRLSDHAKEKLDQHLAELKDLGFGVRSLVRTGPAAQEIRDVAEEEDVDLVLLGAKGENRIREFFLGSTARDLIRICDKPVLVEKFKMLEDEQECAAVCTRKFRRVLLPLDFSEDSLRIYELVRDKLAPWVDEAVLAHIVDQGSSKKVVEKMKNEAQDRLAALRLNLADAGVETEIRIRTGIPSKYLAQIAEEDAVTLVMMPTRGAGNVTELLLGSTAENVARHSSRPVLLFPVKK